MEQSLLVEKLSLQAQSFQDGFKTLVKSRTLDDIIKNFWHLLRGNFIITNIHLYHKQSLDGAWEYIVPGKNISDPNFSLLKKVNHESDIQYNIDGYSAVIAYQLTDSSYLGILLGSKLDGTDLNDFDKITLQILLQVFSSAYESFLNQKKEKKLIFELNEKVMQLSNLIETGIEISRFDKHNIIFELALQKLATLTNASHGLMNITNNDNGKQESEITFPGKIPADQILNSSHKIESSFEFNKKTYQIALSEKETRKGVTDFGELDKLLLQAISRQVQTAIENQHLVTQSIEKERIEKELLLAADIQQKIIPKQLPKIEGYELAGINIPSREVGGDYYDCFDLGKGIYALIIADVSGKGISAALLVNTLGAALHSYLQFNLPLPELADRLNKLIFDSSPPDKYITFFMALLDSKTGKLDMVNAGHNPIILIKKDGGMEKVEAGGFGLGMLDFGPPYKGEELTLSAGDRLFLYTDGIPEAMNKNEEEYSDERMTEFVKNNSDQTPSDFIKALVDDVKIHANGEPQSDDVTCLLLRRI